MKKFVLIPLVLLLTGCNAVISDNKATKTTYDLTIDSKDLDDSYSIDNSTTIQLGNEDVYIKNKGTYILTGEMNDASIIVETDKDEEVKLVLDNVTINSQDFASIYIIEADKVTITLAENSINTLNDSKNHKQIDDNNVDSIIFSKADLIINGQGILNINTDIGHGIVSKDDLIIAGGTINVNSKTQGISGKDCVKIFNGNINIISETDSIKSDNDEDEDRGFVYIAGGEINIDSQDDAIQGYRLIQIDGGCININNSNEGLEAQYILINGGDLIINSKDDGINTCDKSNSTNNNEQLEFARKPMMMGSTNADLTINGGNIYINANGDGIDSNGTVNLYGGTIIIDGPASSGDQAFDYETGGYAYGSEALCIGSSGMAESFSKESTQYNLLYNLDKTYEANSKIEVYLENNEIIFDHTSKKSFDSILLTSSKIKQNETITIKIDSDVYSYTFIDTTNSEGQRGIKGLNQRGKIDQDIFEELPEQNENFNPKNMKRPDEGFNFENNKKANDNYMPPERSDDFNPNMQMPSFPQDDNN